MATVTDEREFRLSEDIEATLRLDARRACARPIKLNVRVGEPEPLIKSAIRDALTFGSLVGAVWASHVLFGGSTPLDTLLVVAGTIALVTVAWRSIQKQRERFFTMRGVDPDAMARELYDRVRKIEDREGGDNEVDA